MLSLQHDITNLKVSVSRVVRKIDTIEERLDQYEGGFDTLDKELDLILGFLKLDREEEAFLIQIVFKE